jgi:antitoxin component YwqK of YwqJK toxin-antitoxin module
MTQEQEVFFVYDNHMIIMKKLFDTFTNEKRKFIVSKEFALYRANKLTVVSIENMITTQQIKILLHKETGLLYQKDKIISTQFNERLFDLDDENTLEHKCFSNININCGGIHYFLNKQACKGYMNNNNFHDDELTLLYRPNGDMLKSGTYKNGVKIGEHKTFKNNKCVKSELYNEGVLQESKTYHHEKLVHHKEYMNPEKYKITEYFDGENILNISTYDHDQLITQQVYNHDTNNIIFITNYKNGIKDGTETMYDQTGNITSITNYQNGLFHGVKEEYRKNTGDLYRIVNYQNGLLHGPCSIYGKNNKLAIQCEYLNNELTGKYMYYCPDIKITLTFEDETLHKKYYYVYDNRTEKHEDLMETSKYYLTGKNLGNYWKVFDNKSEEFILYSYIFDDEETTKYQKWLRSFDNQNGLLYGTYTEYETNNKLRMQCEYLNHKLNGKYIYYSPDAKITLTLEDNTVHGECCYVYDNRTEKAIYDDGDLMEITKYYLTGKYEIIQFGGNKLDGYWKVFNNKSDEFPIYEYVFEDGDLIKYYEYYPSSSNIKMECTNIDNKYLHNVICYDKSENIVMIYSTIPLMCVFDLEIKTISTTRITIKTLSTYKNNATYSIFKVGRVDYYVVDDSEETCDSVYIKSEYFDKNGTYITDNTLELLCYYFTNLVDRLF